MGKDEQTLKRKIFDAKAKEGWIESAEGLQKAAEILKAARKPNQLYANTLWPELMLWASVWKTCSNASIPRNTGQEC